MLHDCDGDFVQGRAARVKSVRRVGVGRLGAHEMPPGELLIHGINLRATAE